MSALGKYLAANKRLAGEKHTHTWFAGGRSGMVTLPLTIPNGQELREHLHGYVINEVKKKRSLEQGPNSVTEKATKDGRFCMYADFDLKLAEFLRVPLEQGMLLLRDVPKIYREVVEEMTGRQQRMILVTRLYYKMHLHFPDVIVTRDTALNISHEFNHRFEAHPMYSETAIDDSVYSSGLRLPWCHKGSMGNEGKKIEEREEYEAVFGAGTWTGIYDVTDPVTWEKKADRTLEDLEVTSILAPEDSKLTAFVGAFATSTETKGKGKAKAKAKVTTSAEKVKKPQGGNAKSKEDALVGSPAADTGALAKFLHEKFDVEAPLIRMDEAKVETELIIVPTRSKDCPFAERTHKGNQLYFVVSEDRAELRCHDAQCKDSKRAELEDVPDALAVVLLMLGKQERMIVTEDARQQALGRSLKEVSSQYPEMVLDGALETITPWSLERAEGYVVDLPQNRYCPICKREHDGAQNCILTTMKAQHIMCKTTPFGQRITLPLAGEHGNVIFAVNNLNVFNISNNSGDEDGQFTELYPITEDSNLNELLLESFNGNAYNLAKVIHYLGRKRLGLGNSLERDTWWVWNETSRKWARSTRSAGVFVSEDVANRYLQCREWFRQNTSDTKLRKVRMEKMNGVIRRLQDRDKQLILKQTAEIFEAKEESIEDKLDSNSYLLGFEGEVYDLSTGRVRLCEPEDYISLSVGYPFPHDIDEEVQGELGKILCEMQPNAEELDYLLKFLASTLNGSNSEEIFTIFTGNGRNGKSVLTDLMRFALSEKGYFHPLQASFLTHERPSSSKPCPDLLNLRGKRFACASEPEGEQKMNAGFVKLLTGNDLLTGSYKHSNEEIIFRGQHSLVLLCNGIPAMDAKDEALWMRSRVVEFPVHFVDNPTGKNQRQRDNSLKDKIPHWGPQFMRLLLRYYVRYQAEGLRPTEGVLRATGRVQKENDLFIEFIEGHFELSEADDDMLSKKEVNAAFVAWCSARGDGRILIAKKNTALGLLKKSMKKAGFNTFEEEDVNGKVIEQKKRVDTTYQVPAYGRIRKKEDH